MVDEEVKQKIKDLFMRHQEELQEGDILGVIKEINRLVIPKEINLAFRLLENAYDSSQDFVDAVAKACGGKLIDSIFLFYQFKQPEYISLEKVNTIYYRAFWATNIKSVYIPETTALMNGLGTIFPDNTTIICKRGGHVSKAVQYARKQKFKLKSQYV